MRADYVLRRCGVFLVVLWAASTLNFFLPRLSSQNPIVDKLMSQVASAGYQQSGIDQMVKEYEAQFGLDQPLYLQYLNYLKDVSHLDFNYSITNYPRTVLSMIQDALPWTIGLLATTTLVAFGLGTLLGALMAWPKVPRALTRVLFPPLLTFSAVPLYLIGLVLVYVFSFRLQIFPTYGGYTVGSVPNARSVGFWLDVVSHSILPALAIVLGGIGAWALGMRAMMVITRGQDYMLLAEAKGLKGTTLFFRYALRNALLPQVTALGLALGQILSGALLVEVVFSFPGIGTTLYHAIRENDYFTIQGIVMVIIAALALATLILDLAYPLLDPRITYRRK